MTGSIDLVGILHACLSDVKVFVRTPAGALAERVTVQRNLAISNLES